MSEDLLEHKEQIEDISSDNQEIGEATLRVLGVVQEKQKSSDAEQLEEKIKNKVEAAIKSCEFVSSPEINEAIKGFYTDHLRLKEAIKAVMEGDYSSDIFTQIAKADGYENWEKQLASKHPFYEHDGSYRPNIVPNAKIYSLQLALYVNSIADSKQEITKEQRLRMLRLAGQSINGLFTESSVGVSTLGEEDINEAANLADGLIEQAGTDELFYFGPSNRGNFTKGSSLRYSIVSAQEAFWSDVRPAGSLVFHGSSDMGGINLRGLMSRNQQLRETGTMVNNTALNFNGDTMHSVVPHFSEFYSMGEYSHGEQGGTLAIPLIKIITEAPYARDAHYAAVKQKPGSSHLITSPVMSRPTGYVGAGQPDYVDSQGQDRVFFSSADENGERLPDDYEISMFDKSNKPATYIILRGPRHTAERELHNLGVGYGFPERMIIEFPESEGTDLSEKLKQQKEAVESQVKELQSQYLEAYKSYGIIVPLRRGVFAQTFENMPEKSLKGRPSPKIYNKYTYGTGRNV
jgi:hypothetical protein